MLTAVVGINWGDEGKGRMVDLFSSDYDIVVRYQGGNNAGHTVVNERGKFIMNLLPSGILRPEVVNILGPGMVLDLEHLYKEVASLQERGVEISPKNLKISDRAAISMPYHRLLDGLEEDRLGDKKFGSTRRGIAPAYADKYMKKTLRVGDLRDRVRLEERIGDIVEWKNLTVAGGYGHSAITKEAMVDWLTSYALPFVPYTINATDYLSAAVNNGKSIMFEAQLGALRDIDFGIYPYTSSSSTIAAYAPIGSGIPAAKLDSVIGIMKAYSTCVGEGPFVSEFFGDQAAALREAGGEYGAATGRPRRVGAFDVVASGYGVRIQGATELALTKLDVLSGMEKIPVCMAYELDGKRTMEFPLTQDLERAKPIYTYFDGFSGCISDCRTFEDLPHAAREYVKYLENAVGCRIGWVSVGPGRDDYIRMP